MIHKLLITIVSTMATVAAYAQISVAEYVAAVVDYSQSVDAAHARSDGADADMRVAKKGYLPSLGVGADASYPFRARSEVRELDWAVRADISQPIYSGGGVRAAVRRAEMNSSVAQYDEQSVTLGVVYDAEVVYWGLSEAEIYRKAIADYYNIVGSLREVVARRYSEGYVAKSDLLQLESRLSDAEYQLSMAEQHWLHRLHQFNTLRGCAPALEVLLTESILDTIIMPARRQVDEVVRCHPDYIAKVAAMEAAEWGVKVVNSGYMPRLGANIYGVWQPNMPNVRGAGTRLDGGVMLSFSAPLFYFGKRREALRSARSEFVRAELSVADVVDNITLNESDAWTNMVATRERVDAVRRNLDLAAENLEISTYSYNEGLATILDVLQAQISWLQNYQNAIAALYDYALAVSAYRYVVAEVRW